MPIICQISIKAQMKSDRTNPTRWKTGFVDWALIQSVAYPTIDDWDLLEDVIYLPDRARMIPN